MKKWTVNQAIKFKNSSKIWSCSGIYGQNAQFRTRPGVCPCMCSRNNFWFFFIPKCTKVEMMLNECCQFLFECFTSLWPKCQLHLWESVTSKVLLVPLQHAVQMWPISHLQNQKDHSFWRMFHVSLITSKKSSQCFPRIAQVYHTSSLEFFCYRFVSLLTHLCVLYYS